MTAVKAGDRVRATCGESVIVGTVTMAGDERIYVTVDEDELRFFVLSRWTVEVLPPLIHDVVGTIVRDRDGDAWQRHQEGWCTRRSSRFSFDEMQQKYGPLTVLWTPEVTS